MLQSHAQAEVVSAPAPAPAVKNVAAEDPGEREFLRSALRELPVAMADDRQDWLRVGALLKQASADYLDLWQEFTARSHADRKAECAQRWPELAPAGEADAALVLYRLADQYNAGWRTRVLPGKDYRMPAGLFDAPPEPWPHLEGRPAVFPMECLPPPMRRMAECLVETMNIPPVMAGMTLLGVASVALGKRFRLTIKEGHNQWGNLYILISVAPGMGKSPTLRPLQVPLVKQAQRMMPEYLKRKRDCAAQFKTIAARQAAVEEKIRKAALRDPEAVPALQEELRQLEASIPHEPLEPCFFLNDATSEAMARRMADNNGFIGVLTSEGRKVLEIARGKYSGTGSDVSLWLAGHGNDFYRLDRVNRPAFEIKEPCIAALIMTQPDSLRELAKNEDLRESGFLARWLYVVPEARPQLYSEKGIPDEVQEAYNEAMRVILETPDERQVRLSPEAFERWKLFHNDCKRQSANARVQGNTLRAMWLAKLPENIARLGLVLHVLGAPESGCLAPETMRHACELAELLGGHEMQANNMMMVSEGTGLALAAWNWIDTYRDRLRHIRADEGFTSDVELCKPNDLVMYRAGGLKRAEEANNILEQLHERGYLRRASIYSRIDRRATEAYVVRPRRLMPQG